MAESAESAEQALASGEAAGYLQQPCLRSGRLCFIAEGDVWLAEAPDWRATRLTALGTCCRPVLSPNAERVAFASSCHGAQEVFLLDLARRRPLERLTAIGASGTVPVAWAADGSRLYMTSPRPPLGYPGILQVPLTPSGAPAGPAVVWDNGRADAEQLSFGPGDRLLVGRGTMDCHMQLWKGYQGGRVGSCWVQERAGEPLRRLELLVEVEVPAPEDEVAGSGGAGASRRSVPVHMSGPAWLGGRIFFVAELDGCGNLWSCSSSGSDLRQHTFHRGLYARNLSSDGESSAVYQRGGELWLYSTTSSKAEIIPVKLCAPQVLRMPQFHRASDNLEYCTLHPDGHHIAAGCRGRIFELALEEGPAVELRAPPGPGGQPAPFARCLAMCFTTSGSLILVREGLSADPKEAACQLELHPPNPYTPQTALKEDHFWALELPEEGAPPQPSGLPDVWGLEPPRVAAVPKEVGLLMDIVASPVDELVLAAKTWALELFVLRLEAHGAPGAGRTLSVQDTQLVARSPYGPEGISDMCWSYDGRWLAYTRQAAQDSPCPTGLWVYDTKAPSGEAEPVCLTDQRFTESSPSFDPAGEYLAFVSKRTLRPVPDEVTCSLGFCAGAQKPFLLLLREDSRNPMQRRPRAPAEHDNESGEEEAPPEEDDGRRGDDEEDDPPPLPVNIEAKGASGRVLELPVQAGRYSRLIAIDGGLVYLREDSSKPPPTDEDEDVSGSLFIYRFRKAKEQKVADNVRDFEVSLDGLNLMLELEDARVRVVSIEHAGDSHEDEDDGDEDDDSPAGGGIVSLDERISLEVEPAEEWAQIFNETWRAVGNGFYDEAMGGNDWLAIRKQYQPLVPRLGCRADLTDLLTEMCCELGASHMSVSGPSVEGSTSECALGFLGADVAWDSSAGAYRVSKVVRGDVWSRQLGGPLARAGVAEGSLLLAVNRQRLGARAPLEKLLANAAGCDVYLTVTRPEGDSKGPGKQASASEAAGRGGGKKKGKKGKKAEEKRAKKKAGAASLTQTVRVRCVDHESDRLARYRDWVEQNCERVHAATQGRVGYIHVPNCDGDGFAHFHRYHLSECTREAVVLDIRGNEGGYISEMVIDRLSRTPLGVIVPRNSRGRLSTYPTQSLRNARTIVLLIDAWCCSDGEVLAASFRDLGLGTIVGMRTWGGVLSVGDFDLENVDGGQVGIPYDNLFSLKEGCFALENRGVGPDLQVELSPDSDGLACDGLDLQLKAGVAEAERLLASRAADAAAVAARCRRVPRTREHLRWRVLSAEAPEE